MIDIIWALIEHNYCVKCCEKFVICNEFYQFITQLKQFIDILSKKWKKLFYF